jgi:hypothetical protein
MNGRDDWDRQGFASKISHSRSSYEDGGEKQLLREREEEKNTEGKKAERKKKTEVAEIKEEREVEKEKGGEIKSNCLKSRE